MSGASPYAYGGVSWAWTWVDGEDDEEGKSWIQIGTLDDEGYVEDKEAVVMHRDHIEGRSLLSLEQWEDERARKERVATLICDALNGVEKIRVILDGTHWSPDTNAAVADVLNRMGIQLREPDEEA